MIGCFDDFLIFDLLLFYEFLIIFNIVEGLNVVLVLVDKVLWVYWINIEVCDLMFFLMSEYLFFDLIVVVKIDDVFIFCDINECFIFNNGWYNFD